MLWTVDKGQGVVLCAVLSAVTAHLLHSLDLLGFSLALPALCIISIAGYIYRASRQVEVQGRAVLITGCDSGFGLALAQHLHTMGMVVVAGVLNEEGPGAEQLRGQGKGSGRLHVIQLDITSPEQLRRAAATLPDLLPTGEGLWGLVNNAGVCSLGPIEWLNMDAFRKDHEVNFFGLVAATKTFLPFVRQARGRVVSIASMAGRLSCGFLGGYSASKYSVEGFNDALRQEMSGFGVKVSLVEPGNFANGTRLFATDEAVEREVGVLWEGLDEDLRQHYGDDHCKKVEGFMKNFRRTGARDISPVLNAITEGLSQQYPQARYCPMIPLAHLVLWVNTHLPEVVYDTLVAVLARVMLKPGEY